MTTEIHEEDSWRNKTDITTQQVLCVQVLVLQSYDWAEVMFKSSSTTSLWLDNCCIYTSNTTNLIGQVLCVNVVVL